MDAATWPSGVWSQTGTAIAPTALTDGVTAWTFAIGGGQRVEVASLLSPTRLDSADGATRLLGRVAVSSAEFRFGLVDGTADTFGGDPTDGAWVSRDGSGDCALSVAVAGVVETAALAFPLPGAGWFDLALELRTGSGGLEALAFVAGLPAAVVACDPPAVWLWPRVGGKGAGSLALDRIGRGTVGAATAQAVA